MEGHGCLVGQPGYLMVPSASQASDSVVHVSKCQPLTFKVRMCVLEWNNGKRDENGLFVPMARHW